MLARSLCLLAALAVVASASAQPTFRTVTRADGLPSDYVQAVVQDRFGFLWFGTDAGLARYDGSRVVTFTADDGLPNPFIYAVAEGPDGAIWVGTFSGLAKQVGAEFVTVETPFGNGAIYGIDVDERGRIIVRAGVGIARLDEGAWRVFRGSEGFGNAWTGIAPQADGSLLVSFSAGPRAESENWISRLIPQGRDRFSTTRLRLPADWGPVHWITRRPDGTLFLRGLDGIRRVQQRGDTLVGEVVADAPGTRTTAWGPSGTLYGGSRNMGVWVQDAPDRPVETISDVKAQALTVDYEGGLWIGTFGQGALRLTGRHLHQLSNSPTIRVAVGGDDAVWATGAGVLRVDPRTLSSTLGYPDRTFRVSAAGSEGEMWVTAGPSVMRVPAFFPAGAPQWVMEHPNWASDLDVQGDTLWLGSYGDGLIRYVGGSARDTLGLADGLGTAMVEGLHRTSHGVWALTRSAGAYLVRDEALLPLTRADGLPSSAVFSLYEAADGAVWVGTDRGLGRWEGRRATALGTDMLANQRVTALFERPVAPGVLWAVGERQLYRVEGDEVAPVDGFVLLPDSDASINDAVYHPATDRLFLATTTGLVAVDLAGIPGSAVSPRVAILGVRVDDERRSLEGTPLTATLQALSPGRHRVEVEFAALTFAGRGAVEYRFDEGPWQRSRERSVVFSDLGSGAHRFEVRPVGVAEERGAVATFVVEIKPHLWERLPVQAVVVALLLLAFGWSVRAVSLGRLRQRVQKLEAEREAARRLQRERERISRDLHDHVGAQLSSLLAGVELARLARRAGGDGAEAPPVPTDGADPLDEVEADARATMRQLRETIWALHDESVSLDAFCTRLSADVSARTRGRSIRSEVRCVEGGDTALPPVLALNLYRIAQEAVTNALKHANASRILVTLSAEADEVRLVVQDDGAFAGEADRDGLSGFGMRSMRTRAEEVGGTFSLSTADGTTVRAVVPIRDAHAVAGD